MQRQGEQSSPLRLLTRRAPVLHHILLGLMSNLSRDKFHLQEQHRDLLHRWHPQLLVLSRGESVETGNW